MPVEVGADSFYLEKSRPSRPEEAKENALDKVKSSSRVHCRPFFGDTALVVDRSERHAVPALQTGLLKSAFERLHIPGAPRGAEDSSAPLQAS